MESTLDLDRLELLIKQLDKANNKFSEAITAAETGKRRNMLEEAFREYVEVLPLLPNLPLIRRVVLDKIHIIESWIEEEIEKSISDSSSNGRDIDIEEALAEARLSLLSLQD